MFTAAATHTYKMTSRLWVKRQAIADCCFKLHTKIFMCVSLEIYICKVTIINRGYH